MSTRELELQITRLNESARYHESHENTILASWMRDSANYYAHKRMAVNDILDSMALGNYEDSHNSRHSRRNKFVRDWFNYEDEYQYNWGCQ